MNGKKRGIMKKYLIILIVLIIAIVVYAQPITPSGTRFFKYLFDTPDSYTAQGGKGVRVNSAADALEFYTIVEGITGNYVATIADGTGIDGTASGEGSTYTPIFDPTELNALTWSDGTNSSNIWTFDVSGTDHTMTAGNGVMTFNKNLTVTLDLIVSGGDITLGSTSIFSSGLLIHEAGGLEADVSGYTDGIYGMASGATLDIDTSAEVRAAIGDETGTGLLVFATAPTFTTSITITGADASPNAAGQIRYDSTVAGLDGGALVYYDDDEVKHLMDYVTAPTDAEDDYHLAYDKDTDLMYWKQDADSGGATAYDNIGNPTGAGSISFDDNETATYTTAQDSAGSFFSLINSNATVSNQVYMLDIDYSADTTEDNADFIRLQDAGSTLIVFEEEGKLTMTPSGVDDATIISIVPSVALTQSDAEWYGIKIDGAALDPGAVDNKVVGIEIDLSGVDRTFDPYVKALKLKMDAGETAINIEEGGVDHFYTIGGDAGATYAVYDIVVDGSSQAATSETHIIDVEVANGDPDGEIVAVSTHTYVAPIHQHIGTYTTPDQVGADSEAGFFDDSATDYIDGIDGIEQFTFDDDAIWISNAAVFHSLEVSMTSDATRSIVPTFWYWKDDTPDLWTEFHPLDTTEGFQHSGTISWDADDVPSWFSADVVELSAGDSSEAAAGYWIAIVRTVGSDPGTPTPTTVKTGTVVLYEWDETGAVDLLSLEADTITEGGNAVWNATETEIIDSDHYIDGSIDHEHLAADVISGMTNVTSEDADYILIWDNTDSALKKVDMGEVRTGATAWDDIGDADGVGSIDFVTYTQTIDIGVTDDTGGQGLIIEATGLGVGSASVEVFKITTTANDDGNYKPFTIFDDSGDTPDRLFLIDWDGILWLTYGGRIDNTTNNKFIFHENLDTFEISFTSDDIDIIWSDGVLNLRNNEDGVDAIVEIEGKDGGEKGILRVMSDGDDKYIELYHDDTDAHIISNSGDIHIEASGGNIVTTNNVLANGNLSVGNAGTTAGVLTILEDDDDGSNFASFTVPALGANTVYILPPDDGDNTEVLQTNGSGTLTWVANAGGGATAWDDISDPDNNGLTTITFDNTEAILFTGDNDATVSFITIQNSDADHTGGNMYLLDLDYSADDGDVDADFIKFQDSGSVVMTIQQNGDITTDGGLTSSGTVEGTTLTEGGNAVWNSTETDFLTNEHIDWANIDYLADEGALTVVDSTYASAYVAIFDGATGNLQAKTDGALTYDATSGTLAATQFSGGGGSLTGVDAATGDAAVDFFGAGVDAVTDATTCTDIEGTGLSIGAGTLNWAAASTDLTDTAALLYETELDDFSELQAQISDKTLVNTADGATWSGTHSFSGTTMTMPKRTKNDDRFYLFNAWNPNALYDTDTQLCIEPNLPADITITEVTITLDADPTTELDWDLKWADAFIGLGSATLIVAIDTTNGTTDVDSGWNDNTIVAGKCLYIEFAADPDSNIKQAIVKIRYDFD